MNACKPMRPFAMDRRLVLTGALAAAMSPTGPLIAQEFTPEFGTTRVDRGRATVPVRINDGGWLTFAVDSAANCSVVASDLIDPLKLPFGERLGMHTLVGREEVASVRADSLRCDALSARNVRLAVGDRHAMDGLDGLLGVDLLADLRLVLNFKGQARSMISRSRADRQSFFDFDKPSSRLVASPQSRQGGLLAINARIGSTPGVAIIDSGAGHSVLNSAAAMASRSNLLTLTGGATTSRIRSPTGRTASVDLMLLPFLSFAGLTISRLPIMVGDLHTFGVMGVAETPAMLLGVDILGLFDSVAIDLKRGTFSVTV